MNELEGRELDTKMAELMGWRLVADNANALTWSDDESKEFPAGKLYTWFDTSYPSFRPSTDIAAAWLVDKPGWYWTFFETPIFLQITLYPSIEVWHKRPGDYQVLQKEIIIITVNWDECKTKAEVYALGRCRAARMAAEAE